MTLCDITNNRMTTSNNEKRLWIGNLDPRVSELYWYQLLKLLQQYGKIDKFDLLFHKTGALAGQPRGYAFVTYANVDEAQRAKCMHNMRIGTKRIIVTAAHSMIPDVQDEAGKKNNVHIPALAMSNSDKNHADRLFQIQAIEAKLRMMETQAGASEELQINKSVSQERSVISKYQCNQKRDEQSGSNSCTNKSSYKRYDNNNRTKNRPYDRYRRR